ncbi:MAG: phenylalanine--tRNA ligase subunit beta [Alphaproteobacteria bacterium]|nr:phenylalanine--tRNA ligase subunit beta [Alphaproteobacteria bacterium]
MKFPLSWLHDHLDSDADLTTLCDTLTMVGLEVEAVDDPHKKLAPFVVAEVVAYSKHPDANCLSVCQVSLGSGDPIQVICGAPNAHQGMKSVFVAPGNVVPSTGILLKSSKIRGLKSNGMLCSERELQLSDEHDGIIDLPADAPGGMAFVDYRGLHDPVIEVALTPNRGDCASMRGIARDLAAAGIGTLKPLLIPEIAASFSSSQCWAIAQGAEEHCSQVGGRAFSIDGNPAAPDWMQQRLLAIGLRPISALVDITNYITHDIGRPLHVFDADKLHGDTLTMRFANKGENLLCLNGNSYNLTPDDLVIADGEGTVSLAGIIGGGNSSCDANTRRVFLEAASFNASTVARTGRRLGIDSDARFRFERKVDLNSIDEGIRYASHLIIECCGGTASELVWAGSSPAPVTAIPLRIARFAQIAGITLSSAQIIEILQHLGCTVVAESDAQLSVTPPSSRPDITLEVCMIEEVLRIYGYDNVPATSLPAPEDRAKRTVNPAQRRIGLIRRRLAQAGLDEVINLSFVDEGVAKMLSEHPVPRISNPINAEMTHLRPTPLAGLLQSAAQSYDRRRAALAMFQIGPGWIRSAKADRQSLYAAGLRLGVVAHWQNAHQGGNDPYAVKADCLVVLELCGIEQPQLRRKVPKHYHPYRSGGLFLGKKPLAYFGNLHPEITESFGFKLPNGTRIAMFEILLDNLPPAKVKFATKPALEQFALQPVTRDLSFALPLDFAAGELIRTIRAVDKKLISDVALFDVYSDDTVRAVAYRVTIQPHHETLTEADLGALCQKIVTQVEKKSPATLR